MVKALLFDVFGTVVDWRTGIAREVGAHLSERGINVDAEAFADSWRALYQPSMERVRRGDRAYLPLDILHRENLDAVLAQLEIDEMVGEAERAELNRAWEKLPPWPDTVSGLAALKSNHIIAPCSNGSIALMTRLARFAGLHWDAVLGADIAKAYKPQSEVYLQSASALGLAPADVMMVAAHNNDLAAARELGLKTGFVRRARELGPGQTTNLEPSADRDVVAAVFYDLAAILDR